ncbi:MobC family plasmid mobilization relaxosome protein [Kribbella solani]
MGEDVVPKRGGGQRRRRANVPGGRSTVRVDVKLSPEEAAVLRARAAEQQVSLPRLLVESTLAASGETPTQRRDAMAKLFALQRTLGGIANNVNQLAKHANTDGRFPDQAFELGVRVVEIFDRIDQVLDEIAVVQAPALPAATPATMEAEPADTEPGEWGEVEDVVDLTGTALEGSDWDTWDPPAPATGLHPN